MGPGRAAPAEAIAAAAQRGVDLSGHCSRLLVPHEVAAADLVIVMDMDQHYTICRAYGRSRRDVFALGDLDPARIDGRAIEDPVAQPAAVFEASYARIDRCLDQLVQAFAER
jgi:protein-tyrosine-phosphatase